MYRDGAALMSLRVALLAEGVDRNPNRAILF